MINFVEKNAFDLSNEFIIKYKFKDEFQGRRIKSFRF